MADSPGNSLLLFSYWRSSSAYRVRIALNLKGIDYRQQAVHLVRGGGEQHQAAYREVNPLGLVPAIVHNGRTIVQSVAICEYLEENFPLPALLPADSAERARVRSLVQTICSEIQPLNNLAVLSYMKNEMGQDAEQVSAWYSNWIARGFAALERWFEDTASGDFCHGDEPGMADCFLVPQLYNAERFGCDLEAYPNLQRIASNCRVLDPFRAALPERQADAE